MHVQELTKGKGHASYSNLPHMRILPETLRSYPVEDPDYITYVSNHIIHHSNYIHTMIFFEKILIPNNICSKNNKPIYIFLQEQRSLYFNGSNDDIKRWC